MLAWMMITLSLRLWTLPSPLTIPPFEPRTSHLSPLACEHVVEA